MDHDVLACLNRVRRGAEVLRRDPLQESGRRHFVAHAVGHRDGLVLVDDEISRLLEKLRPHEESLEYESDGASLIRVTRHDWEKARRVPTELRAEMEHAHVAFMRAPPEPDALRVIARRAIAIFEPVGSDADLADAWQLMGLAELAARDRGAQLAALQEKLDKLSD